jgi:hypothetical protein
VVASTGYAGRSGDADIKPAPAPATINDKLPTSIDATIDGWVLMTNGHGQLQEHEAPHVGMRQVLLALADRLASARDRYEGLVAWRSAEATTIQIASSDRLSLQPLYYERDGSPPGRLLKQRPTPGHDFVEDFFDAQGRWIATCEHTTPYGYYEEFFEHADFGVNGTRFDYFAPDKKPINCSRATFDGDLITHYALRGLDGWWYEVYRRDDRCRVATIECARFSPLYDMQPTASVVRIEYGKDGLLQTIVHEGQQGQREVLYRRPS